MCSSNALELLLNLFIELQILVICIFGPNVFAYEISLQSANSFLGCLFFFLLQSVFYVKHMYVFNVLSTVSKQIKIVFDYENYIYLNLLDYFMTLILID